MNATQGSEVHLRQVSYPPIGNPFTETWVKHYTNRPYAGEDGRWYENAVSYLDDDVHLDSGGTYDDDWLYYWAPGFSAAVQTYNGETNYYSPIENDWWDPVWDARVTSFPDVDQTWGCASCGSGYMFKTMTHYYAKGVSCTNNGSGFGMALEARTQQQLMTGGKAKVARQNLICIHINAEEYGQPPGPDSWWNVPVTNLNPTKIRLSGFKEQPNTNGNTWVVLPDAAVFNIDLVAYSPKHYNAIVTATKYKSYFDLYVIEGNPGGFSPIGEYDEGHAWYGLRTDAPYEGLTNFLNNSELSVLNIGQFGFYPTIDTFPGYLACPGELVRETHTTSDATVRRHFYIGFPNLRNALDFTIEMTNAPPYYEAPANNCVMATRFAAIAAGGFSVPTVQTEWPQYFGWVLETMYSHEEKTYSPLILP